MTRLAAYESTGFVPTEEERGTNPGEEPETGLGPVARVNHADIHLLPETPTLGSSVSPFAAELSSRAFAIMGSRPQVLAAATRVLVIPILWVCLAEFGTCATPLAPSRDRALSELHHTSWTAKDGIPGEVQALAQTSDGYLWLGTSNGLCRFDGAKIERYEPPPGERLPSHIIESLLATPDNGLLIGFRSAGASFLKDGKLTTYGAADGMPATTVRGFVQTLDGVVWAATKTGLLRLTGAHWQKIGSEWNYRSSQAQTLFVDREGVLWVAGENSIVYLRPGEKQFRETAEQVVSHPPEFEAIRQAPDGSIWVGETSDSVRPVAMNKSQAGAGRRPQIRVGSFRVLFDDAGSLWIASVGDGLARVRFPEKLKPGIQEFRDIAEVFSEKNGLSSDYVYAVVQGREGNIWVGTGAGLDRFQETNVVPVALPAGSSNMILIAGDHGDIFTGSMNRVFTHVDGTSVTQVVRNDASVLMSGFRDNDGSVWLGGPGGLRHFIGGRYVKVPLPQGIHYAAVYAIARDGSGALWVSLVSGVYRLSAGVWSQIGAAQGLPPGFATSLSNDSKGRVWFSNRPNRLAVIDGNEVRPFSASDGIDVGYVTTVHEHGEHFWLGGEFGLQLLEAGRFHKISADDEEDFRDISGIVETANGDVWLNAAGGVFRLPSSEVKHGLADANYRVQPEIFDYLDGLPGTAASLQVRPTAIQGTDGRIWFSVANGIVRIDPAHLLKNSLPPPVYISSVTADGKEYSGSRNLRLPVRTSNLQIAYTALSLTAPERVRFRYKLDGVDRDWLDPGTRREAFYTNLGPGVHRFQVIASNNDGVWNKTGAELEFTITPAFYQTRWFLLACLAATGCLIWAAYLWRVRSLTARLDMQFNERLSERTRIAQDLHDTLLQGVLSASIQLDLANEELEAQAPAKPLVERVLELMRQVVDDGRAAVRGLRVSKEDTQSLDHAFSRIPEELGLRTSTDFRVIVEGTPRALHPVIRDEIYRIAREAAANALRHSGAKKIAVTLEYGSRELRLSVRDDGCGIDSKVLEMGRDGHWGLSGMRERAEKIGAKLKFWSSSASGTEIDLRIASRIAYESSDPGRTSNIFAKLFSRRKPRSDSQARMAS
jgi:signal transduction histidine kinase/ligand-binding sensor domain-containing protein